MADNDKLLQETHDTVVELKTALLGIPGTDDKGLVGDFKEFRKNTNTDIDRLYRKHNRLSVRVWIFIILAISSGAISIGELTNLINLFGG